jgi:hypothetical protein
VSPATSGKALAKFAQDRGLAFAERVDLPAQGSTLTHSDGKVEGAATGALPGGIEGTLAYFTYSYTYTDSDDHTHTVHRHFTLVVTQVPESIGFAPYLGFTGAASNLSATAGSTEMQKVELGESGRLKDCHAYAFAGTSKSWLAQLFSPALLDWLGRSDEDFGFELAGGVLIVGRENYLSESQDLATLCKDSAHLAGAIREEAVEETDSGDAAANAAHDPKADDPRMEAALAKVKVDSPAHIDDAVPAFRSHVRGSAGAFFDALKTAVLLTLILNIPGIALPIVLIVNGAYLWLIGLEVLIALVILLFAFRNRVRDWSKKYAEEAFYRAYAESHGLKLEEPLHFAATHAEAKLPFKPDRVMSGPLPGGGEGSLVLCGDGSKRSDRIAVVLGPRGPLAEAGLEAEAPGLSTKDLDTFFEQLAGEAREDKATAPA